MIEKMEESNPLVRFNKIRWLMYLSEDCSWTPANYPPG